MDREGSQPRLRFAEAPHIDKNSPVMEPFCKRLLCKKIFELANSLSSFFASEGAHIKDLWVEIFRETEIAW